MTRRKCKIMRKRKAKIKEVRVIYEIPYLGEEEEEDNVPLADSSDFAYLIKAMRRRRHHKQIDCDDQGESSQTPPRKQKAACRNCRRLQNLMERPKLEELPHVPEGCGYLPMHTWEDEDGHYHEMLSDRIVGMSCYRCDTRGDHWDSSCPNPINDPPLTDEEAKHTLSWKYVLRNFRPTRSVVHRAKLQKQRLAEFERSSSLFYPKCSKCRDRERKERPPLPRGMGYMPHIYTDKRGRYRVTYSDDQVVSMSCFRCGKMGDHWDIHCPDPINDPESPDNRVAPGLCWKTICNDINATSH